MNDKRQDTIELRKRLAENGYGDSFSVDSYDLVKRLLDDMTALTKSYDQARNKEARLQTSLTLAQGQLYPLRKENAQLARENHELHVDQIKQIDNNKAIVDEFNKKIRSLEDELTQSKLLLKAKTAEVIANNQNLDRIREAYEASVDKVVASSRSIKLSNRLPVGTIDAIPNHRGKPSSGTDAALIATLNAQVDQLTAALQSAEDENKRLNSAIAHREQELSRSSKLLNIASIESGEDASSASLLPGNKAEQLAAADVANKRIIDQLNGQVDFLNEQLAREQEKGRQVGEKLSRFETVQSELLQRSALLEQVRRENSQLTSHTRALEQKVVELQGALDGVQSAAARKIQNAPVEPIGPIGESKASVDGQDVVLGSLVNERHHLAQEVHRLTSVIAVLEANNQHARSSVSAIWKRNPKGGEATPLSRGQATNASLSGTRQQQVSQSNALIVQLNKEVEGLRRKLTAATTALRHSEDNYKLLASEKTALARRLETRDRQRDRDAELRENSDLQQRLSGLEAVRDDLARERDQLQSFLDLSKAELSSARTAAIDATLAKQQLESQSALLSGELAAAKSSLAKCSSDLSQSREATVNAQVQLDAIRAEADLALRRCGDYQEQLVAVQGALNRCTVELGDAKHSLAMYSVQAGPSSEMSQLRADNRRLQTEVIGLRQELLRWEERFNSIAQYVAVDREMHGSLSAAAIDERDQVLESLRAKDNHLATLKAETERLQQELDRRAELHGSQESAVDALREEYLNCKSMCQGQVARIAQLEADAKLMRQRLDSAEAECDEARTAAEGAKSALDQCTRHLTQSRQDAQVANQELQRLSAEKAAVEEAFGSFKLQSEQLQWRSRNGQQDLHAVLSEKAEMEVRLQEYKLLLGNTEAEQRVATQRQEALAARVRAGEEAESRLEGEIKALKVVLGDRDAQLRSLRENLEALDSERDRLQDLLDSADERDVQRLEVIERLEADARHMSVAAEQKDKREVAVAKDLTTAHRQCAALEAKLNAAQGENQALRRQVQQLQSEVDSAARDLGLMTRENQALTSQLAGTSVDRDHLKVRVGELAHALASMEQAKCALEIERADLLETYRGVIQDKRRIEGDLSSMSAMKQKEGLNAQQLHDQLNTAHGALAAFKSAERQWIAEKVALGRQLETLNDQLVRSDDRVKALEGEKRTLMQDRQGLQQTNSMLNERVALVINRATSAVESNKALTAQLSGMERERNAVRQLMQAEKQRCSELAQVVEATRSQLAAKEIQLQRAMQQVQHMEGSTVQSPSRDDQHAVRSRGTTTANTTSAVVEERAASPPSSNQQPISER